MRFCALSTIPVVLVALLALPSTGSAQQERETAPPQLTDDQRRAIEANGEGVELARQGRMQEALLLFIEALRHDPELAEAHFNRGVAHRAMEQYEEAAAALRSAVTLRPEYAEARLQLGATVFALGRLEEAAEQLEAALEIAPDLAGAWFELGNVRAAGGALGSAIAAYRRATELATDHGEAHFRLAVVLYGAEEYGAAWRHVHAAQDADYDVNPAFLEALGEQMAEPEREA